MSKEVAIDVDTVNAMSRQVAAMLSGRRRVDCEIALLFAYCLVAEGCDRYSDVTRQARLNLLTKLGARAMCDLIEQVGAMPDAAFFASSTSCQN